MSMFNAKLQQLRNNVDLKPVCDDNGKVISVDVIPKDTRSDVVVSILSSMEPRYRREFIKDQFEENIVELSYPVVLMVSGNVFRFTGDFTKYIEEAALLLLWNETVEPLTDAERAEIEADDRHNRNVAIAAGIGH